ncbi:hypothetical protein PN455_19770 [Dolichospermum circinale CS-539]|nr:hypothetical protein [Dolichospermum circinale CS-539]
MIVVRCQLSVVSCPLSVVRCQLSVVSCALSVGKWFYCAQLFLDITALPGVMRYISSGQDARTTRVS